MINLYHRKNELAIDLSTIDNPRAISIAFSGVMYGESQLPNDWILMQGNNKIICICIGNSKPELLLNYSGKIVVNGGDVVDINLQRHYIKVMVEDIDYWERMTTYFDKDSQYWEGLDSFHEDNRRINKTLIVKNNLIAENDELYFEDGTPYHGEYHMDDKFLAMTGPEYSLNSQFLYRRDSSGKLMLGTKRKSNLSRPKNIIRNYIPNIPSVRTNTKSDFEKTKDLKKTSIRDTDSKKGITIDRPSNITKKVRRY